MADKTVVGLCQCVPPVLLKVKVNLAYFLKMAEKLMRLNCDVGEDS